MWCREERLKSFAICNLKVKGDLNMVCMYYMHTVYYNDEHMNSYGTFIYIISHHVNMHIIM